MDSESDGADWKQEERVLAVVAYRIEKVSQLSHIRYQKCRGFKSNNFFAPLGLLGVFQNWERNIGKDLMCKKVRSIIVFI
jgi:hypothetical protein